MYVFCLYNLHVHVSLCTSKICFIFSFLFIICSFGSGQITVGKFIGRICDLLGDANSQVRSAAIDSMVVIYRHVGVKVRIDLEKRGLPPARMQQLFNRFDELDSTTNHISRSCGEPSDEVSSLHSLWFR